MIPEKKPIITSTCFQNEICYGAKGGNCQLVKYLIGGGKEEEIEKPISKEIENDIDKEIENGINKEKEMDVSTTLVSEEAREATVPEEQRTVDEQ